MDVVSRITDKSKLLEISEDTELVRSSILSMSYNNSVKVLKESKIIDDLQIPDGTDMGRRTDPILTDIDVILSYINDKNRRYEGITKVKNTGMLEKVLKGIVSSIKASSNESFIALCNNEVASIMRSANELQGADAQYIADNCKKVIEYGILTLRKLRH